MISDFSIISASPEIMGGTPVVAETRVPQQTLLDYLKAGESIDDGNISVWLRDRTASERDYAAVNLLNLSRHLQTDIGGFDCSDLDISQAGRPDGLSPRQGLNSSCKSLLFTKFDRTNFAAPSGELPAS